MNCHKASLNNASSWQSNTKPTRLYVACPMPILPVVQVDAVQAHIEMMRNPFHNLQEER